MPAENNPETLPPLPELRAGVYQHYKGGRYLALHTARHSETLEPMVVYMAIGDPTAPSKVWVRPLDSFFGEVVHASGATQARFEYEKSLFEYYEDYCAKLDTEDE